MPNTADTYKFFLVFLVILLCYLSCRHLRCATGRPQEDIPMAAIIQEEEEENEITYATAVVV